MIQRRRNLVPPAPISCSPFLAPIGRGSASTWSLQGLVDVQNRPFHLVEHLLGRPRPLYQVRDRRFFVRPNDVRLHKPQETNDTANAILTQDRAFSFPRAPDFRIHKNRTRRIRESPSPRRRAGGARTSPDPLCPLTFGPGFQANRGRLRRSFFSGSGRNRPGSRIGLPPQAFWTRGQTRYVPPVTGLDPDLLALLAGDRRR